MTKITYIPGEIANAAIDEHGNRKPVTRTQHIFDDALGKPQSQVNQERIEAENTLDGKIALEKQRAEGVESGLNNRLGTVEQLAEISIGGGDAQIATGADFTNPDATKRAKVTTVGAIIDGLNDGVYDVSKRNPTAGPNSDGKFTLYYILSNADTLIPTGWRHGGMIISFVHTSDNKYVQCRYMISSTAVADFTNVANWQGVDEEPTLGSDNLAKSGGIAEQLNNINGVFYKENAPNGDILFTKDDIEFNIGERIDISFTATNAVIDFLDANDTHIVYKNNNSSWNITKDFDHAKVISGNMSDIKIVFNEHTLDTLYKSLPQSTFHSFSSNIDFNKVVKELYIEEIQSGILDDIARVDLRCGFYRSSSNKYESGILFYFNDGSNINYVVSYTTEAEAQEFFKDIVYHQFDGKFRFWIIANPSTSLNSYYLTLKKLCTNLDYNPTIKEKYYDLKEQRNSHITNNDRLKIKDNIGIVTDVNYTVTDGYFNINGEVTSNSNYKAYTVDVSNFTYKFISIYQSIPLADSGVFFIFFDENNNILSKKQQATLGVDKVVITEIPNNTHHIGFSVNVLAMPVKETYIKLFNAFEYDKILASSLIDYKFDEDDKWNYYHNVQYSFEEGYVVKVTEVVAGGYQIERGFTESKGAVNGHKYYFAVQMRSDNLTDGIMATYGRGDSYVTANKCKSSTAFKLVSLTFTFDTSIASEISLRALQASEVGTRTNTQLRRAMVFDLTAIFGAGNEPDNDEFDKIIEATPTAGISENTEIYNAEIDAEDKYKMSADISDAKLKSGLSIKDSSIPQIVNPNMGKAEFCRAILAELPNYANRCQANMEGFDTDISGYRTWGEIIKTVNHIFRRDVIFEGESYSQMCNDVNKAFTENINRFNDALPKKTFDPSVGPEHSLKINIPSLQEPSAIITEDNTLYIYGKLMRTSTVDGVNWTDAENIVLTGEGKPSYILHCGINYIDSVYYLIGTDQSLNGSLHLFTSTDGLEFVYRGKMFDASTSISQSKSVVHWGNPYLIKEYGSGKMYLYQEVEATDSVDWEVYLLTCNDILHDNGDGTIGDWSFVSEDKIFGGGNVDFAKGFDNRPIRSDGKYYIYFHGNYHLAVRLFRASSEDLKNWTVEGIVYDNRDKASNDNPYGNGDHCIVEYKGRTYLFYTWDINGQQGEIPYIKYTVDDRPLCEILKLLP